MTPVKQTVFGKDNGNCLAACFASMLNIPVDHVPNWGVDIEFSWNAINMFLSNYELFLVVIEIHKRNIEEATIIYDGYYILSGASYSQKCNHAVIYKGTNLFFDPMPNDKGLKGPLRGEQYYQAMFFVPKEI